MDEEAAGKNGVPLNQNQVNPNISFPRANQVGIRSVLYFVVCTVTINIKCGYLLLERGNDVQNTFYTTLSGTRGISSH